MSKDLEKRMDIIFLKSLLIENTAEALPKMIESKKEFILFLTSLNETIQEDSVIHSDTYSHRLFDCCCDDCLPA